MITLDRACELTRTGDVWLFRGTSGADRAIRSLTNAPVNHVGMTVALDDLPPLLWHAELGHSLPDMWSGKHHRGVQLHDLRDAVLVWGRRYGQRGWLRQLDGELAPAQEDALLRTIARLDGTPFPSTLALAGRWLRGRLPAWRRQRAAVAAAGLDTAVGETPPPETAALETAYCAEVVAVTFAEMGLLRTPRRPAWYDPGRFWSGDALALAPGFTLGGEIEVTLPPADEDAPEAAAHRWPRSLIRRR